MTLKQSEVLVFATAELVESIMKYLMFTAFSMYSLFASAGDISQAAPATTASESVPVVQYDYSQKLDIAKVIRITSGSSFQCEPVKSTMIYLDSQGVRHNLQYLRMSDGCVDS